MRFPIKIILLALTVGILGILLVGSFQGLPVLSFWSVKRTSASQTLWERVQRLQSLNTVRSIQKIVFPFDYLDPQINFSVILTTLRRGKGTVNSLLSPKERDYLEARELSDSIGFRITGNRREFVVVTVNLRVGVELQNILVEPLSDSAVRILVPAPKIIDIAIEDPSPSTYPYPDPPLTPQNWKRVAEFVNRKVLERPLEEGISHSARVQANQFLTQFFQQAGFTSVEIQERTP